VKGVKGREFRGQAARSKIGKEGRSPKASMKKGKKKILKRGAMGPEKSNTGRGASTRDQGF